MRQCLVRNLLVLAAIGLLASGCSEAGVTMVKGKVLYNGEPLPDGELEFRPEKDLTLGSFGGATDSEGRFEIKIGKGTGMNAKPGRYVVLITKGKAIGISPPDAQMSNEERVKALMQMGPGGPGVGGRSATGNLPERYSNAATTPFKVEISAGANDLNPFRMEGPPLKRKS